ncbi:glycosyltransferase family 2 protein [bacterium]|nr:glycosyltransferase family 2 protein [bacterium]
MPAYNEEDCIKKVIDNWMTLIEKYQGSVMVVINDGSKDNTAKELDNIKRAYPNLTVIHKNNEGHGAAVLKGYGYAVSTRHNWVLQTDSDDQFTPDDFNKLWEIRNKSNFIIGYRQNRNDPFHRIIISRLVRFFNLLFFGIKILDANVPYRLMKRDYLKRLLDVIPENLFAPNIFLSILAKKDGQDLMNIPINHKQRKTGSISIVKWNLIKVCLRGVKELILFRLQLQKILRTLKK